MHALKKFQKKFKYFPANHSSYLISKTFVFLANLLIVFIQNVIFSQTRGLYEGDDVIGLSWKDFYNKYKEAGGDGFYGGHSVVYEELVIKNLQFIESGYLPSDSSCEYSSSFGWKKGLCPVAEEVQPKIMQFKTNYRNLDDAKNQASILKNLIKSLK